MVREANGWPSLSQVPLLRSQENTDRVCAASLMVGATEAPGKKSHADIRRTCKPHKLRTGWPWPQSRIFLLWDDSTNHWTTVPPWTQQSSIKVLNLVISLCPTHINPHGFKGHDFTVWRLCPFNWESLRVWIMAGWFRGGRVDLTHLSSENDGVWQQKSDVGDHQSSPSL